MNTTIPATIQVHYYASKLAQRINEGKWDWNVPCTNWDVCGSMVSHRVIADNYYPSPADAEMDGVEFGIRICHSCLRRPEYLGSNVLATREYVNLHKSNKCSVMNADCHASARTFLVIGNDEMNKRSRKYMCMRHISIHSMYRNVYGVTEKGQIKDVTEMLRVYYEDIFRPKVIG